MTNEKTAKLESVGAKVLGALLLSAGFLGSFALLARADLESSAMAAPAVGASEETRPAPNALPASSVVVPDRPLGDVGEGRRTRGLADVADLLTAIKAEGDAPGPDSELGRPPQSTRLFSGKLDAEGTQMFVYETHASLKETQAWADERAKAAGLGKITIDGKPAPGDAPAVDPSGEERQAVPGTNPLGEAELAKEAAQRRLYGGHDGRVAFSIKDEGDKRIVTLVALPGEKLSAKIPQAIDAR